MSFDHLIFGADRTDVSNAVRALADFNCIQVKKAVDPDFLRAEHAKIASIKHRFGSAVPPYKLLYRLIDPPYRPEFPLIKLLQTEPLHSILSQHLESSDLMVSTHHASELREVQSLPLEETIDFHGLRAEPFHQDSSCCVPQTFGKMVIVWLLMDPMKSGVDIAPTLKLVPGPIAEILPIEPDPKHPWSRDLEISHQRIDELSSGTGIWIPDVDVGDAIIFTGMCPHGTYVPGIGHAPRFSCEIKVWGNSDLVHDEFLSASENHPGHIVVNKHFIVGPIDLDTPHRGLVADRPNSDPNADSFADLSSGRHDFDKVAFKFGRIGDERDYSIPSRSPGAPTPDSIVLLEIPDQGSVRYLAEVLDPKHTGRPLGRVSRVVNPADLRGGKGTIAGPSATGFDPIADSGVKFVTCLRDPIDRTLERLNANLNQPSQRDLEFYLDAVSSLDILPAYFAQISSANSSDMDALLQTAIENIEAFFPFVCIQERFAESAFLLFHALGWPRIALPRTVPTQAPLSKGELAPSTLAKLQAKLQGDIEIYTRCVDRLEQRIAQTGCTQQFDDYRRDYTHLSSVLGRTHATIAFRATGQEKQRFKNELSDLRRRNVSLDQLAQAQKMEITQLHEKVERMEASYTALLRQHLEATKVI